MKILDINTWNRKQHYEHFIKLKDPYFGVTIPFDVTIAYEKSKAENISFFGKYLHDCMLALNSVENFKYRIENNQIVIYDTIDASATIQREDKTFGFSYIDFDDQLEVFLSRLEEEKQRIQTTTELFPLKNSLGCIHCSAMPWFSFVGHKEPVSGLQDSVPKLAFSKAEKKDKKLIMNVAIQVNHALVDGYHINLFAEAFQNNLNKA